jgi:nucleotide-binding universal stress UspA family protein
MRILVPIDFSSFSWETLRFAANLRALVEPVLILLHVVRTLDDDELSLFGGPGRQGGQREKDALQRLEEEAALHLPQEDPLKVVCKISHGIPFKEICSVSEAEKAEMIIIATHGRSGLSHLLIGSTAERVVQHASCPVLSLKPKLI